MPEPKAKTDYTREELIAICERSYVPMKKWSNRDSYSAQEQLAIAHMLLKNGVEFVVSDRPMFPSDNCVTNDRTIYLEFRDIESFQYHEIGEDGLEEKTAYLPTPARLDERTDQDWY